MLGSNWGLRDRPELGAMNAVSKLMRFIDLADRFALPDFAHARTLLIGSDYSGQHSTSDFEALGFLIADSDRLQPWHDARRSLRSTNLPNGRRMSFKNLGDKKRTAALPRFLDAAEQIQGLLLVVLVDKRIKRLFQHAGDDARANSDGDLLSSWPSKVEEKLLRICHVAALLVAGLSRPGQNVVWISDQDEIAANDQRLRQLTEASGRIMSAYLEHSLGHLRVGTTASDSGTRDVEDFVAIADLAAGALCEVLNAHRRAGVDFPLDIFVPNQKGMASKIDPLTWWLSRKRSQLKKIALSLEPIANSSKVNVRHYDFSAHWLHEYGRFL
ncbi:hypothetical protein [Hydrogenophaga sp. ZJX-1]|uniref:hypothetical protein n=1 Tax=Hydrogenophaga sp. ZJX-1 TaxID=3404778 RepID=UPI003B27F7B2